VRVSEYVNVIEEMNSEEYPNKCVRASNYYLNPIVDLASSSNLLLAFNVALAQMYSPYTNTLEEEMRRKVVSYSKTNTITNALHSKRRLDWV